MSAATLPFALLAVAGIAGIVVFVARGEYEAAADLAYAPLLFAPIVLLWRVRVRLVPSALELCSGFGWRRIEADRVRDLRIEVWGQKWWRGMLHLDDGSIVQVWGLSAHRAAPGFARQPPASLVDRVAEARVHVGLPV